jgi:hypothetical protein
MIEWRRSRLALWLSALALLTAADVAGAQTDTYPSRPVRLIVPFAAGGLNDVVARLVAPYLERAFGQPFIIDNRPAASGIVGTDATAKATPDGYTLLMVASSFTVIPATHQKVPYDAQRDLAPIVMVAKNSLLFLVNPKVPAKSLAEFVALAKADPGKFNYASPGRGDPDPSRGRAVQPEGRHQDAAHPVSRRSAGDDGDGRGRNPVHGDLDAAVAASRSRTAYCAPSRAGALPVTRSCPTFRPWPSRAFPGSKRSSGSDC